MKTNIGVCIILTILGCYDSFYPPKEDELIEVIHTAVYTETSNGIIHYVKSAIKNHSDRDTAFIVMAEAWVGDQLTDSNKKEMFLKKYQTSTITIELNGINEQSIPYSIFRVTCVQITTKN